MRHATILLIGLCSVSATLQASEPLKRKPGLWQMTVTSDNPKIPVHVQQVCLDAETDALLYRFALGANEKLCSRSEIRNQGSDRTINDSVCSIGATRMTIHGETVFAGDEQYRETVHTHYDPARFGRPDSVSNTEAKWVGACPAGVQPGDLTVQPSPAMPTGMHMNLKEAMSGLNPQPLPPKTGWSGLNPQPLPPRTGWSSLNPQPLPPKPAPWRLKPPPEPPQAAQQVSQQAQ